MILILKVCCCFVCFCCIFFYVSTYTGCILCVACHLDLELAFHLCPNVDIIINCVEFCLKVELHEEEIDTTYLVPIRSVCLCTIRRTTSRLVQKKKKSVLFYLRGILTLVCLVLIYAP